MSQRNRIIRRVTRLMVLCQSRRVLPSVQWLSRELGVCQRTVYRDLMALHEAGYPVPPFASEMREAA